MDAKQWKAHIVRRSDFSTRLTHLTRRTEDKRAIEILYKILDERKIIGSSNNGFIIGEERAVCFQELPLLPLAENVLYEKEIANENETRIRYEGCGIRFNKGVLFQKYGACPVIYGNKEELKEKLKEEDYWRIVTLDYSDSKHIIDWTHEREWRVKGDLEFDYKDIEVIVGGTKQYREFIKHYVECNPELLKSIKGIIVLESVLL